MKALKPAVSASRTAERCPAGRVPGPGAVVSDAGAVGAAAEVNVDWTSATCFLTASASCLPCSISSSIVFFRSSEARLNSARSAPKGFPELGQLLRAEDEQRHDENQDQFGHADGAEHVLASRRGDFTPPPGLPGDFRRPACHNARLREGPHFESPKIAMVRGLDARGRSDAARRSVRRTTLGEPRTRDPLARRVRRHPDDPLRLVARAGRAGQDRLRLDPRDAVPSGPPHRLPRAGRVLADEGEAARLLLRPRHPDPEAHGQDHRHRADGRDAGLQDGDPRRRRHHAHR